MTKIVLIAEVEDADSIAEAVEQLTVFRETALPYEHGIVIYTAACGYQPCRDYPDDPQHAIRPEDRALLRAWLAEGRGP